MSVGHLVGRRSRRRDVVRRRGGHRDVAVHAGVEADHRDAGGLGLLEQRSKSLGVNGRQADGRGLLVERGLEHLDLLVDHRLGLGAFEGDVDVEFLRGLLRTDLHGLPELVLEPLGNDGDVRLGASAAGAWAGRARPQARKRPTSQQRATGTRSTNSFLDISDSSLKGCVNSSSARSFSTKRSMGYRVLFRQLRFNRVIDRRSHLLFGQ